MAIINFSPLISEARGKVGDVIFSRNTSGAYVKQYVDPGSPQSGLQLTYQTYYSGVNFSWKNLTDNQRAAWRAAAEVFPNKNRFGNERKMTGYGLFMKLNLNRRYLGQSTNQDPPLMEAPTMVLPVNLIMDKDIDKYELQVSPSPSYYNNIFVYMTDGVPAHIKYVKNRFRLIGHYGSNSFINMVGS